MSPRGTGARVRSGRTKGAPLPLVPVLVLVLVLALGQGG